MPKLVAAGLFVALENLIDTFFVLKLCKAAYKRTKYKRKQHTECACVKR